MKSAILKDTAFVRISETLLNQPSLIAGRTAAAIPSAGGCDRRLGGMKISCRKQSAGSSVRLCREQLPVGVPINSMNTNRLLQDSNEISGSVS